MARSYVPDRNLQFPSPLLKETCCDNLYTPKILEALDALYSILFILVINFSFFDRESPIYTSIILVSKEIFYTALRPQLIELVYDTYVYLQYSHYN